MSRTDLDAATLANSLRSKAGDGNVEWVYEPIQASVLLDIADMLADNAKLRERITTQKQTIQSYRDESREWREAAEHAQADNAKLRELVGNYASMVNYLLARQPMLFADKAKELQELDEKRRELGVEVEE